MTSDNDKKGFTSKISYAKQYQVYVSRFNDGREVELLNHIFTHPSRASFKNNPKVIIAEIDAFATKYLMNIGKLKGSPPRRLVTNLITTHSPATITELAGLSDLVKVIVGPSSDSLRKLKSEVPRVDMLFLGHYKPLYTDDLMKIVGEMGMIGVGSFLVADNVVKLRNPRYLKYVRMGIEQKLVVAGKVTKAEEEGGMVESFEPTGIPVCYFIPFSFFFRRRVDANRAEHLRM
ncbi:hypothetical protein L873DRAFT_1825938 [Choiromyces venosus 120613-1]|uniref:Uncharacterized protein n=1 Tax=Choiromyces venosus 120613-1 TaxID=1336337 RepID=A0A3N4KDU3_9PEZI|nr:hypothetical protein L873DRAFT_1825938 [Choiromyces venosus 120613-1]